MAATARITTSVTIGGTSINSTVSVSDESAQRLSLTLPAGKAGTLSTRTDADTGVLTVASGHGITTSDKVAVFWEGGAQYNCDVSATTGTTISIDAGDGDDLPTASTAIVVAVHANDVLALVGDKIKVLAIDCRQRALVEFLSSVPASLLVYDIPANEGRFWYTGNDFTNPLAGDTVATVRTANGSTTAATLEILLLTTTT